MRFLNSNPQEEKINYYACIDLEHASSVGTIYWSAALALLKTVM